MAKHESLWQAEAQAPQLTALTQNATTDVLVVGGGITGITAAYLLQKAGREVMLTEGRTLGAGVTSATSAHLTPAFDSEYYNLISDFGLSAARHVYQAMAGAVDFIEQTCQTEQIECAFRRVKGYLYAELEKQVELLDKEFTASLDVGMRAQVAEHVPLPFHTQKGILYHNHAQFHALQYLYGLAGKLQEQGGSLYDNSHVTKVSEENGQVKATLENGAVVTARELVMATHSPVGIHPVHTEVAPYRSYIVVARVKNLPEEALYWDMYEPYHYIRQASYRGQPVLIIGGCDHKTGQKTDTAQSYAALKQYTQERFEVEEFLFNWSGQVFEPADGLPYIGKAPLHKHVYITTGYSGDGLTWGTAAARLLTDLITSREHPLADIVSPARMKVTAAAKNFITENVNVAYHFVRDRLMVDPKKLEDILPDEGKIIRHEGKQIAVYRDAQGTLHGLDPVCSHMKCIVQWNQAEKTWDCPCHGGRFRCTGEVLDAPPMHALKRIEL